VGGVGDINLNVAQSVGDGQAILAVADRFQEDNELPPVIVGAGHTRLVRDWNGKRYEVVVAADGFVYDGAPYRSLSAIAKAITGAHWNGKLFFGVAKGGAAGKEARR